MSQVSIQAQNTASNYSTNNQIGIESELILAFSVDQYIGYLAMIITASHHHHNEELEISIVLMCRICFVRH